MKRNQNVLLIAIVLVGILGAGGQTAHAILTVTNGLVGQWDARNIDGLNNTTLTDGGLVSSWLNLAPGAADSAAQATAVYQPTFITNGFGSRPVVRFDGINDALFDSASSLNVTGNGLTIFILMQQSTANPAGGFFGTYGGANTGYYLAEDTTKFYFFGGASVNGGITATTLNQPLILGAVKDASSQSLYTNGSLAATAATATPIASSAAPLGIGNDGRGAPAGGSVDGEWPGDYRHILVYDRALSPSEFASVNSFLNGEIPEPSAIALLASGGLWLFLRRRADGRA